MDRQTITFLRKSVSNEIGSTKTDDNFRLAEKQHLIFKNSSESRRIWARLSETGGSRRRQ